jgi:hypothetical protein
MRMVIRARPKRSVKRRIIFVNGDSRKKTEPGEVLFVPAGAAHKFEDYFDVGIFLRARRWRR